MYPEYKHDIPEESELKLGKLKDGFVTGDNCNTARKSRKLIMQKVIDSEKEMAAAAAHGMEVSEPFNEDLMQKYDIDCLHHVRNTIIGGVNKRVSTKMRSKLRNSFDKIHFN